MNTFEYKHKKPSNYFEGWYLRITDSVKNINFSFIFGITMEKEEPHAFIQIYDGIGLKNTYYKFDVKDFDYEDETIKIGENRLSQSLLYIEVDSLTIDIDLTNNSGLFEKNNISAMGFLSRFPLQCFQEVIIMKGEFSGTIKSGNLEKLCNGVTYMEKTYGRTFPKKWIWIQSNHFDEDISLTFSYGKMPLLFWKVNGFFAILHYHGKEYRFATYNFSSLKIDQYEPSKVLITVKKKGVKLTLDASMINPVTLVGPSKNGVMNLGVNESINGNVVAILEIDNHLVFESTGSFAGIEIMNK